MTLPNVEDAYVEERKVTAYLLNEAHPQGRTKARFFRSFGFTIDLWETFAEALRQHGRQHAVVKTVVLNDSTQYVVEGEMPAPDGRSPFVRTVWEVAARDPRPRLITAYPTRAVIVKENGSANGTGA